MNIVILGAGESGVGAALLAKQKGHDVFVSDGGALKEKYKKELHESYIPYEENKHTRKRIYNADLIVKSPGIPDHIELITKAHELEIPVISEIEFASRHTNAVIIGITGSNGKTTTTKLTYHLLHTAGLDVGIGGNVGHSFARLVAAQNRDFYVLELSSFQLDGIVDFCPNIAILLNITPDHLDRYDYQMDNYIRSKFRIIENQRSKDLFIYNALDENMKAFMIGNKMTPKTIAIKEDHFQNGTLTPDHKSYFQTKKCRLKGPHNMFNAICAIHTAKQLGATDEAIQKGLDTFVNAPHRLEKVATINEVEYINDSKATNVDAVYFALKSMDRPVILVIGGKDKGNDYEPILSLVKEKVKAMICLGIDNEKIKKAFASIIDNIEETQSTIEALEMARSKASSGDVVLLSPACASFDLFKNYEDRGDQFKQAVLNLKIDQQ